MKENVIFIVRMEYLVHIMTQAQADADAKIIEAKAEADANKKLNSSITENLIKMKEAEARYKHGWVTVKGADTVVTDAKEK